MERLYTCAIFFRTPVCHLTLFVLLDGWRVDLHYCKIYRKAGSGTEGGILFSQLDMVHRLRSKELIINN